MKVFLSSTYVDLIEHRKAAHDALEQLGLHVIWMEAFGARPEESTKACLDEVEESDLFVGIYAYRYGYVPNGSDISITEQELDHAQKLGKPIFGFIVNEDHPWPPKFIEHDKKSHIEAFRDKIKKQPIELFTTPDNLAHNIASSVGHFIADLKSISISHKPIGSNLPHQPYFFGRKQELMIIDEAISPESRTWGALIDGPGGIGKTALAIRAGYLASSSLFDYKIFITSKIRELTPSGEATLVDFTRPDYLALLSELALEIGENNIHKLPPEERPNALRLSLLGKKALIIFDNLETLPDEERTRLFQFLSRLPPGNKAIVTSRRRSDVEARVVRLDRMRLDDAMDLIYELSRSNKLLSQSTEQERRKLYDVTNGNPLLIKWVAGQLGRERGHCRTLNDAYKFIDQANKQNDPLAACRRESNVLDANCPIKMKRSLITTKQA